MKSLLLIAALVIIAGCTTNDTTTVGVTETKIVEDGDIVSVHYTGMLDDGSIFDSSEGSQTLDFTVGAGQMIEGFDQGVLGMKEGESKTLEIPPEKGYGLSDPERIIEVEKNRTPDNVQVGDTLYFGSQPVIVLEINNDTVTIDTNHFLVGQNLTFEVTMVSIIKGI